MEKVNKFQCVVNAVTMFKCVPCHNRMHNLTLQMEENPSDMRDSCKYIE